MESTSEIRDVRRLICPRCGQHYEYRLYESSLGVHYIDCYCGYDAWYAPNKKQLYEKRSDRFNNVVWTEVDTDAIFPQIT